MTFAAYFFMLTSIIGWTCYAHARRRLVRELRRQSAEHITDLAIHGLSSFRKGLAAERERQQRATIFTTIGANAVADQPRAGVSCAGREVSVSAPHIQAAAKERREPAPEMTGPNSGILTP